MCPQTINRGCTRASVATMAVEPTCIPALVRVAHAARWTVRHDDIGAHWDRFELGGEELLAITLRRVERPVVEPRLPGRPPDPEPEQLDLGVLEVMAPEPLRNAPRLDRLIVVSGDEYDLGGWDALEPELEVAGE